jgi:hypothetical protein
MTGVLAGAGGSGVLPRVSGGTLTSDSTYYYRTFTSSGTLSITNGRLEVSALGVGGGAGGGWGFYGGNAGQVAFADYLNLAGNVGVTVGAGGAGAATQFTQGTRGNASGIGYDFFVAGGYASTNAVSDSTPGNAPSGNGFSTGNRFQWAYGSEYVPYYCCGDYCTCSSPWGWYSCYCCGMNCGNWVTTYAYFAGGGAGAGSNGANAISPDDDPFGGAGLSYFGSTYGVGGRSRGLTNAPAYTAAANTGNGGGNVRVYNNSSTYAASAGGSGIVIIRYLKSAVSA